MKAHVTTSSVKATNPARRAYVSGPTPSLDPPQQRCPRNGHSQLRPAPSQTAQQCAYSALRGRRCAVLTEQDVVSRAGREQALVCAGQPVARSRHRSLRAGVAQEGGANTLGNTLACAWAVGRRRARGHRNAGHWHRGASRAVSSQLQLPCMLHAQRMLPQQPRSFAW
jgi:hypothetical protein|eukprot:COSAG01_NODE_6400_length_3687_cov_16.465162_3_plen_168_part_00